MTTSFKISSFVFVIILFFAIGSALLYRRVEQFDTSKLTKTIWMFWEQGWDEAPAICKVCMKSWIKYNPDWTIVLLDSNNITDYIDLNDYVKDYKLKRPIQIRADILRTNLLNKNGGLWVDATVFCTKPLNDWIYPYIKTGFFAFEKDKSSELRISNWMLYAQKNHYIIDKWATVYNNYWKHNDTSEYFKHVKLFGDLYKSDATFNKAWNDVKKFSASIPHTLKYKEKHHSIPANIKQHIYENKSPLYKLDHNSKTSEVLYNPNVQDVYSFLMSHHSLN
uniref:Capsular polysaccharide synthesis protein n=1 Tax=Pyramimonas orientalis virus TaxID=455367 RepID=A0A7M3UP63_POV01|nr:hypothetical protein HWQ62_00393 [Pyramimonas orientalis virus]